MPTFKINFDVVYNGHKLVKSRMCEAIIRAETSGEAVDFLRDSISVFIVNIDSHDLAHGPEIISIRGVE